MIIKFNQGPLKEISGIPRFVESKNYTTSFGIEWEYFKDIRSKANNGSFIKDTIHKRTDGWDKTFLSNKNVLEAGCGPGDDTSFFLDNGAKVYSFDYSNSVNLLKDRFENQSHNLKIFQADITNIPFDNDTFDIVYCHRVLMHVKKNKKALEELSRVLKPGGHILVHSYGKNWKTLTHWRYKYNWFTKRIPTKIILNIGLKIGPTLSKLVRFMDKKWIGKAIHHNFIPWWNLEHRKSLGFTEDQILKMEQLNFVDSLTPTYDYPLSLKKIQKVFMKNNIKIIKITSKSPLVVLGIKE